MTSFIIGAGLSGLLAAHAWQKAELIEQLSEGELRARMHAAVLRFRSDAVSRLTGIPFRQVTVRKGIWSGGAFVPPSIGVANRYAQKCVGALVADRSIWSADGAPAARWVAPQEFPERLLDAVLPRIEFGWEWTGSYPNAERDSPIVSTIPLPVMLRKLEWALPHFQRAKIWVQHADLPIGTDVHQTVYFPDDELPIYRASMTGRRLIMEFARPIDGTLELESWMHVERAFGISMPAVRAAGDKEFGKIVDLPTAMRKPILAKLTADLNVYSLGRFATWRNILLDDVVQDIEMIRRMQLVAQGGGVPSYDGLRAAANAI